MDRARIIQRQSTKQASLYLMDKSIDSEKRVAASNVITFIRLLLQSLTSRIYWRTLSVPLYLFDQQQKMEYVRTNK